MTATTEFVPEKAKPGRLARNSALGAVAGMSTSLSSFLCGIIVARALGVAGTGTVAYIIWIVVTLAPVVDIGMQASIGRYTPEFRGRGEHALAETLSGYLYRVLLCSVGVAVAIVALVASFPALTQWVGIQDGGVTPLGGERTLLALMAVYIAMQVLGTYSYAYLRGSQAFGTVARFATLSLGVQLASVAVGSLVAGVTGALVGYIAGQLMPGLASLRFIGRRGEIDPDLRQRIRRYATFAWAANVANAFVWSRIEIFFLARSWGPHAVGIFTVAMALSSFATQGPIMLTTGVLAHFSEQHGRGELDAMKEACATGTRLLALLIFPSCLGMVAIMPVLLPLLYGHAFTEAVPAGIILVSAAAITASTVISTNLLYAMERSDFIFATSLFGGVLAVLAGFFLVPVFGILGAAAGRAFIQLTMVAIGCWFVVRRLKCPLPFAALGRLFAASALSSLCAGICVAAIGGPLSLFVAIPVAAAVYVVGLKYLRPLPPDDLVILRGVAGMLPSAMRRPARAVIAYVEA
ncbi:lipopolysaccharide biosynthesis protein [Labrys monachus]|uniref:O-antigen/teichoic acid export membrane protein n=1 Tax=Labrys monachus TaxID=217067 RepID=A0ABU0FAI6_9HYPH|nr:polysaccharide biosynthesis C-terminal domain-containing protein [Labrys monachus]MDQ0391441.1 O-antigen/teichoic acid export membrane protein [Labrys monachus]